MLLKKAAGIKSGSGTPNTEKVGKVNRAQLEEIATTKMPDLTAADMDAAGNLQMPPIEVTGSPDDDMEETMAEMDAVFAECEQHLAGVTMGAPDSGMDAAFEDAFVEYAGCMREQGIDMPDPDFSDGGMMIEMGSGTPGDEAEFEAAHKECQSILAGIGIDF